MKKIYSLILFSLSMYTSIAQTQALADTSLENTLSGGTDWVSTSTNFPNVFCDAACGNCGGPCAPHTGSVYAWFGGSNGGNEIGTLEQTFTVSTAGTGSLSFWFYTPQVPTVLGDSMRVRVDGNTVWSATPADSNTYKNGYVKVTVPIGTISSGTHTLSFYGTENSSTYNQLMDDITLTISNNIGTQEIILDEQINIFNNHQTQQINVAFNFEKTHQVTLYIYDASGKSVKSEILNGVNRSTAYISTAGLSEGVYTVNLQIDNSNPITKKVFVRK